MDNFADELKELMIKHEIKSLTPISMNAEINTDNEIFINYFNIVGKNATSVIKS